MAVGLDIENYKADTRSVGVKFLNNLSDKIRENEETTNSASTSNQCFVKTIFPQFSTNAGLGNVFPNAPIINDLYFHFTGRKIQKISELPELTLYYSIDIHQFDLFDAHTNSINVPVYFVLWALQPNVDPAGSIYVPWICYPLGDILHNEIDNTYNFVGGNPSKAFNLKDCMVSRDYIDDKFDFSNTNDRNSNQKITREQYLTLVDNSTTNLISTVVFDTTGLSVEDLTHLENAFSLYFGFSVTLTFSMFGNLASFVPTTLISN
jgi:hypothetical protein